MLNKISQVISGLSLIKFINSVIDGINAHLSDYNNPHKVTAAQLGLSNAYKYKGSVETYEDLPTSAESGDVYNVVKGDKEQGIADGANFAWNGTKWDNLGGLLNSNYEVAYIKNNPNYYNRDELFTTNKTTVTIPKDLKININGNCYISTINKSLQLSTVDTPANLAGKDVYIYACEPTSGTEPIFVLSLNSTVPTGYTANNSRKIGGFHCLCKDVGVIEGHTLSGYVTGDILPATRWDLLHRPKGEPEGFAYEELIDCWLSIYHLSWDGTKLVSVYNGVIADGASTKKWHGEAFIEQLMNQKMRLPWRHEFQMAAKGSNEGTGIKNAADPNTTGGHVDSNNRRMISNIGLEDCCGCSWQWAMDLGFAGGSEWNDSVYNSNVDSQGYGQSYGTLYRLRLGARWPYGSDCGSRSVACDAGSSAFSSHCSARGASEPRVVTNLN